MQKSIIIFGASSGLGRASAEHFANNNWNVLATARNKEKLAELKATNPKIETASCDVSQYDQVVDAFVQATNKGSVEAILITAGGGFKPDTPLEETDPKVLEEAIQTNVFGTFNILRYAKPLFAKQEQGRGGKPGIIVGIGSRGSLYDHVLPNRSPYTASKHAQLGFLISADMEFSDKHRTSRSITICPGYIPGTGMVQEWEERNNPQRKGGTPIEKAVELIYGVIDNPKSYRFSVYILEYGKLCPPMEFVERR